MKGARSPILEKVRTPANLLLVVLLGLASCGGGEDGGVQDGFGGGKAVALLKGDFRERWKSAEIPNGGDIAVTEEGVLRIGAGKPMTGAVYRNGDGFDLPVVGYVAEFEARRLEGSDFFAALTFPVGSVDRCATLVLGGWGGSLVGISSIDHLDASENATRASIPFENGRWYRVKVEVTKGGIRVWIDGGIVVNAVTEGRVVGMRGGDIERCMPFGFASYWSAGEVRGLTLRKGKG